MNNACLGLAAVLSIALPSLLASEGYTLKVIEYRDQVFSMWGDSETGPWYESWDGIVCEVYTDECAEGSPIQKLIVVQSFATAGRLPWPEDGTLLHVETFDISSRLFPVDEFTVAFDTLIFRKQEHTK